MLVTRSGHSLKRIDSNRLDAAVPGVPLFTCVRNESLRLPYFLNYYRTLGVTRFFIIDNGSSDGTVAFLDSQPDVQLFTTSASYSASNYGVDWLNRLLTEFGSGHWVLVVDADELLVYRDCEASGLSSLIDRMERANASALLTFMLDMYAKGPIRDARYEPGTPFIDTCRYFDVESYSLGPTGMGAKIPERGGVRRRVFWRDDRDYRGKPPYLPKIPLVKWSKGMEYLVSTHRIEGVRLAQHTGALLHFKLFSDMYEKVTEEVARAEHWDGAAQYSVYAEALDAEPDLDPYYSGSMLYRDSRQLIELGLIIDADEAR